MEINILNGFLAFSWPQRHGDTVNTDRVFLFQIVLTVSPCLRGIKIAAWRKNGKPDF
jgi:hypothetical protein